MMCNKKDNIDLSDVPNGFYMVKISGCAVGSSGTASVSVTLN